MEGVAERDRRAVEGGVAAAWWTERFAREERLQALGHYLAQFRPKKPQTAEEVLAVFEEHRARGADIQIRHFGPDGKQLN